MASLTAAGPKPLGNSEMGGYIDGEEAALHDALQGSSVTVTRAGNRLAIDIPAASAFDAGKSQVKPQFTTTLYAIALVLKNFSRTTVDVLGYADSQGSPGDSQDLTQRRAVAVASLLSNQGVDQRRFFIEGRGGADPIASNATEAGRAQNRRVEIQIAPLD